MGTVVDLPHKQLNMKVMGFVVLALACCLLAVSGAPAPIVDPVSVAFTAAGGLVLTAGTATANIMFLASNICCVNSGTVNARYCCEPREVRGAKPVMKKCNRGKGIKFTAILRKSQFNCPGKRKHVVTPLMAALTRWFRSPYVGVVNFNVLKQMSYNASLSKRKHSSAFSTSWWKLNTAL